MAKKVGWSFTVETNVEVQQDKLNKASKILEAFYDKYEDRSLKVDTSDLIKSVKQGVAVIKNLYEDGTKDATSWLNIRPQMKEQMEGILSDANKMFSDIQVQFNNGMRVRGLADIMQGFDDQLSVTFADINGAYDELIAKQRELANSIDYNEIDDYTSQSDIRNHIDLLRELIQVQDEMASMNPSLSTKDLVGGRSSKNLQSTIHYYKEVLDEMAKYKLQTYGQYEKHRQIFFGLEGDYTKEKHESNKYWEEYDEGIEALEQYIKNRKDAIEKLREYEDQLPESYGVSKYIDKANADIQRYEKYLSELKLLRGDEEPIVDGGVVSGNLSEVVEELGKIEQAIRDVLAAFQPLTDALSSDDSAISKFVNASVEDLNKLQMAFKETFDDIKALSQKDFNVNTTTVLQQSINNPASAFKEQKNEAIELVKAVKYYYDQIAELDKHGKILSKSGMSTRDIMDFKAYNADEILSGLRGARGQKQLDAWISAAEDYKTKMLEVLHILHKTGMIDNDIKDISAPKKKNDNIINIDKTEADVNSVLSEVKTVRDAINNEVEGIRNTIKEIFNFDNLNPNYAAIEFITDNIYQKFVELQTRINALEFNIQTPKFAENVDDTNDILSTIKTLSEQIETELTSIRSKIDDTFNFATVTPNVGAVSEIVEKIYQQFVELQSKLNALDFGSEITSRATEGVSQTSGIASEKLASDVKSIKSQIELELQSLRQNIEATFDFSTINPNVDNITNIIDKVYRHFEELQNQINKLQFKLEIIPVDGTKKEDVSTSNIENTTKAIQNEGDAAADAVPKKNAFVEANEKVAESMKATGDAGKDAAEGIAEEIKAATKAGDSLDRVRTVQDAGGKPMSKTFTSSEVTDDAIITTDTHLGYDELGKAYISAVQIVEDFKKRANQLKKDADKVALAKKTLEKFISQFESKTAGQASTIKGFDDLKNFNIKSIDDIEEATRKMVALDNEYNKITKSFRQGTKSMNPFVNAITGIDEMSDKIKSVELSFDALNNKPKELGDKVAALRPLLEKLNSFIIEDDNGNKIITDIYGLAEAYGQLNVALRQANSSIALQRKEERIKSAESKKEEKRVKELYKLYEQQAESAAKIYKYRQKLNSGELGQEEARLVAAQLKQEKANQAAIQRQIRGYKDLYEAADQAAIILNKLYMVELQLNAESEAKEQKAKEQELNALYKERGSIITNIIALTKKLNSLKTDKAKARVQQQLDTEEMRLLQLDEEIDGYGNLVNKSKLQKQDDRLTRAGIDVINSKEEAQSNVEFNRWLSRRADVYQNILTLKKQLAKADGDNERDAIQKEIDAQEALLRILTKKLALYKDTESQQKVADQDYKYMGKQEWLEAQQGIDNAADRDKDNEKQQKQDYQDILMLVQKIFAAKKELHKMGIDTSGAVHTNDIERATKAMQEYVTLLKEIFGIDIDRLGDSIDQSGLLTQEQKNKLLQEELDYKEAIAKQDAREKDKAATRVAKQNTKYGKPAYNRESKYFDIIEANERAFADIGLSDDFLAKIEKYKSAFKELQQLREKFASDPDAFNDVDLKSKFQDSALEVEKLRKEILAVFKESQKLADLSDADILGKTKIDTEQFADAKAAMINFAAEVTNGQFKFAGFNAAATEMYGTMQSASGAIQNVTVKLDEGTNSLYAYQTGANKVSSSWQKLKGELSSGIKSIASMYLGIHDIIRVFRQGFTYVKEIDLAMTELRKVTDETDATYANFLKTASNVSSVIGSTVSDFTDATAAFARLGYSINESAKMAETAIVYKNVADGLDTIEESTDSIISTMMAYGIAADDTMSIIDRFNAVGNNFAITSAGIGDAMQRSASALKEGGNTIDESIGLITAAM